MLFGVFAPARSEKFLGLVFIYRCDARDIEKYTSLVAPEVRSQEAGVVIETSEYNDVIAGFTPAVNRGVGHEGDRLLRQIGDDADPTTNSFAVFAALNSEFVIADYHAFPDAVLADQNAGHFEFIEIKENSDLFFDFL